MCSTKLFHGVVQSAQILLGYRLRLQLAALCVLFALLFSDSWAECGYLFVVMGPAWSRYLSCVMCLWLAFPFIKDSLREQSCAGQNVWYGLNLMYICRGVAHCLLWDFDLQTLAGVPLLNPCEPEFLLGCGADFALQAETPFLLAKNSFWIPLMMIRDK